MTDFGKATFFQHLLPELQMEHFLQTDLNHSFISFAYFRKKEDSQKVKAKIKYFRNCQVILLSVIKLKGVSSHVTNVLQRPESPLVNMNHFGITAKKK